MGQIRLMTNIYHLFFYKHILFLSMLYSISDEWYSIASNEWKWSLRYFQSSIMQKVLKKWIIIITKVSDFLCILLRNTKDNVFVIPAWYCHYNVLLVITHLHITIVKINSIRIKASNKLNRNLLYNFPNA